MSWHACPSPSKPESIARNDDAATEWVRIVEAVGKRGNWDDATSLNWLLHTCLAYAAIARMMRTLTSLGRGPHTEDLAAALASTVDVYRFCVSEFDVPTDPLVALRHIVGEP